jgi:prepilin-type N-terminal cleavage/methylation domain-containing protein
MIRNHLNSSDQGFTLFEAMVALAILALGLGAFYRSIAGGAAGERRVERAALALEIARARLAAEGMETALAPGAHGGDDPAGYHWTVTVQRYADASERPGVAGPVAFLVRADVTWLGSSAGARPGVSLSTVKIGPAQ